MDTADTQTSGSEVEFPPLPAAEIPENAAALRRILAGQRALRDFYAHAEKGARGEAAFICRLLRRDFAGRLGETLAAGEALLVKLRGKAKDGEGPAPAEVEKAAARLRDASPEACIQSLSAFAARACFCSHLVPWVSEVQEVFEHFQRSLEAEDHHLSVLELLRDLVCGPEKKG
jgi:hypothetical protein